MALMTWSAKNSVGVEALDNQHKDLMRLLNEFHAASIQGKAQKVAGPLLRQIASLANEHFSAEERLMESARYPGLAKHRAQHRELTAKVAEFVSRHEKGDATICTQLLYFMRDWLTAHMQTEDRQYTPWLSAHGAK
jgi:hemerythrin